jgi:hypothetical protein
MPVRTIKALSPSPGQMQLVEYGMGASFKRLDQLGSEP